MNHNLLICYYLDPETSQNNVDRAIASLGNSTNLFPGVWYVNGVEDAEEAVKRISSWMSDKDRLVLVDAANNICRWYNVDDKYAQRIRQNWHMGLSRAGED